MNLTQTYYTYLKIVCIGQKTYEIITTVFMSTSLQITPTTKSAIEKKKKNINKEQT